jgi:hypothetical protein
VELASTPRFELYREAVRGDAAKGRPVIERCELVPPAGVDPLGVKLVALPSLQAATPVTTLGAYFEAQAVLDETERRLSSPRSQVLVAWRDVRRCYVDEVRYRIEGLDDWARGEWSEEVDGSFADFIRFSPLFQRPVAEDAVVLELSKSPGMPNTRHFTLEVFADGRFEVSRPREHDSRGADVHRLTTLLIAASRLPQDSRPAFPRPFVHDAQTTTVSYDVAGRRTRVTLDSDTPSDIQDFVKQVAAAYDVEL